MRRVLQADAHYDRAANAIFRPSVFGPSDYDWMGYDVIVDANEDDSTFVYMVPDLNSNPPAINVYKGKMGDPDLDTLVCAVVV